MSIVAVVHGQTVTMYIPTSSRREVYMNDLIREIENADSIATVSYTHLTLPTIRLV